MEKGLIQSKVFFDDLTHSYINEEGKFLLGVTSLMKKYGLSADYSNIDKAVLENAAKRGTKIHEILESYDNGEAVEDTPMIRAYKALNLDVLCSEYLVSDNEVVASKIDKVLADYSLADVKATSKLHIQSLRWQLSIYAYLFEKQNPTIKVPALYAIHIQKSGKVKMEQINRIDSETIEELIEMERNSADLLKSERSEDIAFPSKGEDFNLSLILSNDEITRLQYEQRKRIELLERVKLSESIIEDYREKIYEYMANNNIKSISSEYLICTRIDPYFKDVIDADKLKTEYSEIATECTNKTLIKGNVRLKYINKK